MVNSFDIIILNGKIIDGSGNPWFKADIGIKDEKIIKIGDLKLSKAEKIFKLLWNCKNCVKKLEWKLRKTLCNII